MQKEIGYIGLGKMGRNMVLRLLDKGWNVVAYNRTKEKLEEVEAKGATGTTSIQELVSKLPTPRTVWLMVSHEAVDEVLNELVPLLEKGDIIIDGGNSPYQHSMRRSKELELKGIEFLDIGVSGGPGGTLNGACMMVGGKKELYDRLNAAGFFSDTCVPGGHEYMGISGTGHFVKMVHNGIEYGMMQSIAEGFDLMRHSKEFDLDLEKITEVYSHGSVVTSRLVSWMHDGYKKYGKDLNEISGRASALGEAKWTLEAGQRENISMPAIQSALLVRGASQKKPSYQGKVVSTMRGEFGQHPVKRGDDEPEIL
ncbi:MAG TPA: decarboxylating 6-phosphogluconate dehydrogenase [Candidatus Paceibacterota bacterium]|jgi:6-phosphogluconate dehydrogenase|nr:decarboxylating 6-phosphogluconate dehydrogenase [Candidatus Paceibacterota bacterium]